MNTSHPQRLYAFAAIYAFPAALQLESPSFGTVALYILGALHMQVRPSDVVCVV
jgi:hypothetical protein